MKSYPFSERVKENFLGGICSLFYHDYKNNEKYHNLTINLKFFYIHKKHSLNFFVVFFMSFSKINFIE